MRLFQWDYIILFWLLLTLLVTALLFLLPALGWGDRAGELVFRLVIFDWLLLNLLLLARLRVFRLPRQRVHQLLFGLALFLQGLLVWRLYFSGTGAEDGSRLGLLLALAMGGLFVNAIWMAVRVFGHPRFLK